MKKILSFLNGNKSIICLIIWNCIESGLIPLDGGWHDLARIIIGALTGGALFHHAKKGNFKAIN